MGTNDESMKICMYMIILNFAILHREFLNYMKVEYEKKPLYL